MGFCLLCQHEHQDKEQVELVLYSLPNSLLLFMTLKQPSLEHIYSSTPSTLRQ